MQLLSPGRCILPGLELDLWGCNPVKGPLCPVITPRRRGTGYPTASGSLTDPEEPALTRFKGRMQNLRAPWCRMQRILKTGQ